jgi:F0F1-type ATP synthase assembly protein I
MPEPEVDPFEAAFASSPKSPAIPEILTRPVDHPTAAPRRQDSASAGVGGLGKAWGMAMDFVFTIIAAAGLGYLASLWLGHRSAWVLGGLGVGFVLAMMRIVRTTLRDEAREQAAKRRG